MRRAHALSRLIALPFALALALVACDERRDVEHERERERRAAANLCSADSECYITGCHGTLCRAALTETFCEHRLRLAWRAEEAPDEATRRALTERVRAWIEPLLDPRERPSLTVAAHRGGILTTFHTSPKNRARIRDRLAALDHAGLALPAADAEVHARAALDAAPETLRGRFRLRPAVGAPALLETEIDTDGPEAARARLNTLLREHTPDGRRWVFEHLPAEDRSSLPVMRAWLIPAAPPPLGLAQVSRATLEDEDTLALTYADDTHDALARTTRGALGRALLLVHHDEVLAAPRVSAPVTDGHVAVRLSAPSPVLREALARLVPLPEIARALRFDPEGTAAAEADIACYAQEPLPASCGCVEGTCQWQMEPALEACIGL